MEQTAIREKVVRTKAPSSTQPRSRVGVARLEQVATRPKQAAWAPKTEPITRPQEAQRQRQAAQERLARTQADQRVQHELAEMRETHDLRDVDDDVEALATLFEWRALEHTHRPKSATWFAVLAGSIAVISAGFAVTGNLIAAITIALAGGLTYYVAQQDPKMIRYRLMTDGVAFNNTLYHYQDLDVFNIVYKPGETKTVLLRSHRPFAPLLHMEIGDTDPVAIRDLLLEFVREDLNITEPLVDIYARRLGF